MTRHAPASTLASSAAAASSIDLRDLAVLEAVAEEQNFSAAARTLGVTRADVSRTVARLEQRLDVRLCTRTTRSVALTDAGRELVRRVRPALREIGSALAQVSEQQHQLSGPIRVACSHAFARHCLIEPVTRFAAQHPGVEIGLTLNDRMDDLVLSSLDLAVRIGPLAPSSMVARRLGRLSIALVAAPALGLQQRRLTARDLPGLPAVGFRVPGSGERYPWRLQLGQQEVPVAHQHVPMESDSIEAVADLARLGAGAALLPRYLVQGDLQAGRLVELPIKGGRFVGPDVHLCFVSRHLMPARVRALCDELAEVLPTRL
jgi:DNA-binding transcriptional LysR family regulator